MVGSEASLRDRLNGFPGVRIPSFGQPDESRDFIAFAVDEDSTNQDAEIVIADRATFQAINVEQASESGFELFLDGIQKTTIDCYYNTYTLRRAYFAAGLFQRQGPTFDPSPLDTKSGLKWYVPDLPALLERLQGIDTIAVPIDEKVTNDEFDNRVRKAIARARQDCETALGVTHADTWGVVDGGIGEILRQEPDAKRVGLIKSHRKQYFRSADRVEVILNLQAGQRTTVFIHKPHDEFAGESYSFYMKLHDSQEQSPFYGLIRVEIPNKDWALAMVDEIASWILAERDPLALPERRADRMIYPIALVEDCLRALEPYHL